MPVVHKLDVPIRLAEKSLLKRGRISLSEIRRMRFVESRQEAIDVANSLIAKHYVHVVKDTWNGDFTLKLVSEETKRLLA